MLTLNEDDIFISQSHMLARLYDTLVTPEFFSRVSSKGNLHEDEILRFPRSVCQG